MPSIPAPTVTSCNDSTSLFGEGLRRALAPEPVTPERAAERAAEVLEEARKSGIDERVVALVAVADGWTRLHTALANAPKTIEPAPTVHIEGLPVIDGKQILDAYRAHIGLAPKPEPETGRLTDAEELAKMRDAYKDALARVAEVIEVRDIQGKPGNWDVDEYQRGYYNGLELAVSILDGDRDPVFRDAPASGYRTPKRASDPDPPTVNIIG